jgi:hypothetical protein
MQRGALTLALALVACSGQELSSASQDAGGGAVATWHDRSPAGNDGATVIVTDAERTQVRAYLANRWGV